MGIKKIEKVTTPKTVQWFVNREDILRFDLNFQRNKVWSDYQKSLLIHSLLIGYPLPPMYSVDKGDGLYWILDGKQRLTSIIDFVKGKYVLHEETPDVYGEEIAGKYFDELSDEMKKDFLGINLMVFHFKNINMVELEEMFYRYNNGTPLSRIEKTRSRCGELLNVFNEYLERKLFKEYLQMTGVSRNRFKDTELLIQTMMVFEGLDEYKNVGSNEIERFIKEKRENGLSEEFVDEFNQVLDYVEKAGEEFTKKELKMFKKVNVPVIVKVAKEMMDKGMSEKEFGEKLVKFFVEDYEKDGEYAMLVKSGTSKKENIEKRIELLYNGMMEKELLEV